MKVWCFLIALLGFSIPGTLVAQRESNPIFGPESQYSRKFFTQLKGIFGRFRDADLDRVFEAADPIKCSEMVSGEGEWRTVAFFNEKRELGDWYRSNLDEVKHDLTVFTFNGVCRGEHGPVQLTTKFPVTESIEAYTTQKISLEQVEVNVNAPVRVTFDPGTSAYSFDLPYLFFIKQDDSGADLYSLDPPRLADRQRYARDVIDHWDCKSVTGGGVTYRFLICKTTTLPSIPSLKNRQQQATFGASAYFILSDGEEASSNVKLTFNDTNDREHEVEDTSVASPPDAEASTSWETPDSDEKILDVLRDEFRIRFAQNWATRIVSAQVLYGRQMSSLDSAKPAEGADYCVWLTGAAGSTNRLVGNADEPVEYSITIHDRDNQSSTSIVFDLKTPAGLHLGTLQCYFPRVTAATSIDFGRWKSVVGDNLLLEVKP